MVRALAAPASALRLVTRDFGPTAAGARPDFARDLPSGVDHSLPTPSVREVLRRPLGEPIWVRTRTPSIGSSVAGSENGRRAALDRVHRFAGFACGPLDEPLLRAGKKNHARPLWRFHL